MGPVAAWRWCPGAGPAAGRRRRPGRRACPAGCAWPTARPTGSRGRSRRRPGGGSRPCGPCRTGRPMDEAFTRFMDLCVQCRACEVACPSAVPFGRLMEGARAGAGRRDRLSAVVAAGRLRRPRPPPAAGRAHLGRRRRPAGPAGAPPADRAAGPAPPPGAPAAAAAERHRRVAFHRLRHGRLAAPGPRRHQGGHRGDRRRRRPARARAPTAAAPCTSTPGCTDAGPPAGRPGHGRRCRATPRSSSTRPGAVPPSRTTATCSARPEAERFAARVRDVHEWLAERLDRLPAPLAGAERLGPVAVQDPCHLRQVQRCHEAVRTVLGRYADAGRARRRRAVLRRRRRLQRPAPGAGPTDPRPQAGRDRPHRRPGRGQRQPRLLAVAGRGRPRRPPSHGAGRRGHRGR